ncbi:hypothetical protein V1J52_02935 [Streptomyces sp. TRM 70351]|uniref:hypothetical protein n=1 Tax=Streptomyces sp. TRM 70351 TaxID=3116552 RepID=UPI002E7BCA06|nr:hypothetical protein [Streptomyces sp. TRM 70351]MEE1927145.1 hypothetical protein [Streptomyces sp. TRM 70351]
MAEVRKVVRPAVTASSRPCAFVSPDKGNAPTIIPVRKSAQSAPATADQPKQDAPA